jgi:hypothetical protein
VPRKVILGNRNELAVGLPKHIHKTSARSQVTRLDHGNRNPVAIVVNHQALTHVRTSAASASC